MRPFMVHRTDSGFHVSCFAFTNALQGERRKGHKRIWWKKNNAGPRASLYPLGSYGGKRWQVSFFLNTPCSAPPSVFAKRGGLRTYVLWVLCYGVRYFLKRVPCFIFRKQEGRSYSKYYNCKNLIIRRCIHPMLRSLWPGLRSTTKKGEYSLMVKRLFVVQLIFVQFKVYTE